MSVNNIGARAQMDLPTSRCDAMELSRRYCQRHDGTTLSNIYSDTKVIHPVWPKVTKTPYATRAHLVQGYGREKIMRSYISKDAPHGFFDPEKVVQPANRMDKRTASVTQPDVGADPRVTAMNVLPGGISINNQVTLKKPHAKHRTYKFENRTLMDQILTDRSHREPIKWPPMEKSIFAKGQEEIF